MTAILEVRNLTRHYPVARTLWGRARRVLRAVERVSFRLREGETLALVGESGSGKSTLARLLLRLEEPTEGEIFFDGEDLLAFEGEELRRKRREVQMIFQDPHASLNPRMTAGETIRESLRAHGLYRGREGERVAELLGQVGLGSEIASRTPGRLSGGQRQRVGIARALATEPRLLVADEPVSALDVSVRAQIVNLLARLQRELGLTLLFITHDLAVVEQIADRVAVLYLGRIVERAPVRRLFDDPQHPYTVGLIEAVPDPDPRTRKEAEVPPGEPPSPVSPPPGCPYHPRCPIARSQCSRDRPPLLEVAPKHRAACHFPGEMEVGRETFPGPMRTGEREGRSDSNRSGS